MANLTDELTTLEPFVNLLYENANMLFCISLAILGKSLEKTSVSL